MVERIAEIIVLAEDIRQANLARRYLTRCGHHPRTIVVKRAPRAMGSGEQYVREQYAVEVASDPSMLGLGDDLIKIGKEVTLPSGGRLNLLFASGDNQRYEVEVQLGATDPSHIIRTIEYWDLERSRYPERDHIAVLVAEDTTSRFLKCRIVAQQEHSADCDSDAGP